MDKSWIKIHDRTNPVFLEGLKNFVEYLKNYLDKEGKTKCPCKKCCNCNSYKPTTIYAHIHDFGFQQHYTTWVYHGERYPTTSASRKLSLSHKRKTPATTVTPPTRMINNEMFDVIEDVTVERDIHEEHTEDDTHEENIVDDTHEENTEEDGTHEKNPEEDGTGLDPEYDALFEELNAELYPGCTEMSSLNFLAKLMHIKVINKWTNCSFDQLLALLRVVFPKGNRVPTSHYEAKKKLKTIGLGYKSIHVCKYDCALFWKENEDKEHCPVCNESRWVDKNTNGKKVPHKVLRYFPLTPRLRRMYSSRKTAKDMVWHNTGRSTDDMMRHPVDGKEWHEFDGRYPVFASEPRNVRLGLAADGFNPFGNMNLSYSMWPVVLTTYNTPPWLCMKESSFMLTLLIPGPKSPGKDFDVFLRPLVDELDMLWKKGVQTRDAATNTIFRMHAALLWTINDYPACSSLSGWSGQGYKACPTCNVDTPSCRVTNKIAFVGHRRFLRKNNKMRQDLSFNGKKETANPPRRLNNVQILEQLQSLPPRVPGKHPSYGGVKRKRVTSELNWNKRSIFYELEYWSSLTLRHNLDVMHVEKNVCESLLGTLLMNEKSKDTKKSRQDLEDMGIRPELWLQNVNNKTHIPHAPYSFKPVDRKRFCQFIKGVRLPDGFGSNFKSKVSSDDSNITGLKSHDHHILIQRLLPTGVKAGLPSNVSKTITDLCIFFKKICARSVDVTDMFKTHKEVVNILCNLESIYPPAFFDIMVHLVLHLPEEAILGGPVYMRWMYPFERYMKKLKAYVRNKARPEGSIAEGYIADEALTFCSMYFEGVQTKFNRPDRNMDAGIPKRKFAVFSSQCRPMSKTSIISLDKKASSSLHWFVLNNCDEIKDYKTKFESEMPGRSLKDDFALWFHRKIIMSSDRSNTELRALAHGPVSAYSYTACIVNGVRFVVQSRDIRRTTQNSGVLSVGEDGTPFYGQLDQIIQLNYMKDYSVVMFRCKWFDTSGRRLINQSGIVSIDVSRKWFVGKEWYDPVEYILATQAQQVFYLEDPSKNGKWCTVEKVHHRKLWDHPSINVVKETDLLHDSQSSDYELVVGGGEVGESSAQVINDDLVVNLGYLPMRTTQTSSTPDPPIMDEEGFIDDEEDDENTYTSDDEEELSADMDDNDDNVVDTQYYSDDSD